MVSRPGEHVMWFVDGHSTRWRSSSGSWVTSWPTGARPRRRQLSVCHPDPLPGRDGVLGRRHRGRAGHRTRPGRRVRGHRDGGHAAGPYRSCPAPARSRPRRVSSPVRCRSGSRATRSALRHGQGRGGAAHPRRALPAPGPDGAHPRHLDDAVSDDPCTGDASPSPARSTPASCPSAWPSGGPWPAAQCARSSAPVPRPAALGRRRRRPGGRRRTGATREGVLCLLRLRRGARARPALAQ